MPAPTYTSIRLVTERTATVLNLLDRRLVEQEHVQRVSEEIQDAVKNASLPNVILNFEKVEFVSSSMLGVVIASQALVQDRKGKLALAALTPDLRKLFKMMKLDTRIKVCDSVKDALQALG